MKVLMSFFTAALIFVPSLVALGADDTTLPSKYKRASEIIGAKVVNATGENLGKIEDIVLDKNGRIAYAVLSFGGFLGIGDKLFAIPWQALREDPVKEACVLAIDKERLKNAPGFNKENWPDMADPRFREEVYRFYGIPLTSAAEGWGAETRSFEGGPIQDLKREAAELPLGLKQGTRITYQVECPSEGTGGAFEPRKAETTSPGRQDESATRSVTPTASYVRFDVTEVSRGEATVAVTCSGKESKSCTIKVSKDGTVQHDASSADPGAASPAAGKDAKFACLVAHIFGQGLHDKKLEPGREYTMPGSLHQLTREETAAGQTRASAEGTHSMRFEGVTRKSGKELAVFSLPASTVHKAAGTASEVGVTGTSSTEPAGGARRSVETGAILGRAAYRLDDGLLEKLIFDGAMVRRLDPSEPND